MSERLIDADGLIVILNELERDCRNHLFGRGDMDKHRHYLNGYLDSLLRIKTEIDIFVIHSFGDKNA